MMIPPAARLPFYAVPATLLVLASYADSYSDLYCSAAGRTQLSKFASFPMLAPLPPIVHQQGAARERRQTATHPFELPLGPPPTAAAPGAM